MAETRKSREEEKVDSPKGTLGSVGDGRGADAGSRRGGVPAVDNDDEIRVIRAVAPGQPGPGGSIVDTLRGREGAGRIVAPNDDETERQWPWLWELLTVDRYRDKTTRHLPELLIRRVSGAYEVTLRDHASRQQKTAYALTLAGLWESLEAALVDPTRPWKPYDSYLNPDASKGKPAKQKGG